MKKHIWSIVSLVLLVLAQQVALWHLPTFGSPWFMVALLTLATAIILGFGDGRRLARIRELERALARAEHNSDQWATRFESELDARSQVIKEVKAMKAELATLQKCHETINEDRVKWMDECSLKDKKIKELTEYAYREELRRVSEANQRARVLEAFGVHDTKKGTPCTSHKENQAQLLSLIDYIRIRARTDKIGTKLHDWILDQIQHNFRLTYGDVHNHHVHLIRTAADKERSAVIDAFVAGARHTPSDTDLHKEIADAVFKDSPPKHVPVDDRD